MTYRSVRILIDAREFTASRVTGISHFLEGLITAATDSSFIQQIVLAVNSCSYLPSGVKNNHKIITKILPRSFLHSEKILSHLSKQEFQVYISPYPKLSLFGIHCPAVHTVHDVLDLTHPAYRKRLKTFIDTRRLKKALKKASLTWFDSRYSLKETQKYAGYSGANPRVRYPGLDMKFSSRRTKTDGEILNKFNLKPGYILVIGNGLPHKNWGVLLKIESRIPRKMVFVGASGEKKRAWISLFPQSRATWIENIPDADFPSIIRGAFCLAQPSTAEGYGYPPLEAMACGIPAIVSQIPILKETTGGNALFVPPQDPNKWRDAFNKLEEEHIYDNLATKGLRWAEPLKGKKAWKKHIQDLEELIKEKFKARDTL
ncbi:MAG: glycosyltransferase family 4 protein [Candidatus Aminicenantes bacterium]|nr:glycosyltransferase family 4 protein [Candidatus Aminicenantes bacterium]